MVIHIHILEFGFDERDSSLIYGLYHSSSYNSARNSSMSPPEMLLTILLETFLECHLDVFFFDNSTAFPLECLHKFFCCWKCTKKRPRILNDIHLVFFPEIFLRVHRPRIDLDISLKIYVNILSEIPPEISCGISGVIPKGIVSRVIGFSACRPVKYWTWPWSNSWVESWRIFLNNSWRNV